MVNEYKRLRAEAQRLTQEEFARRFPSALIVETANDWAGFDTQVVEPDSISQEEHEPEGPEVRLIVKSDRNPYADRISVGRAQTCDLVIRDPSVSKLHCHFLKLTGSFGIRDANSKNGVTVNGRRIGSTSPEPLKSGDSVHIGYVESRYLDAPALWTLLRAGRGT